ncbi:MAG: oxidoreductase [Actinobacteria bacterium]|nr:oxidoreductase [Actinomycetota bacterium]
MTSQRRIACAALITAIGAMTVLAAGIHAAGPQASFGWEERPTGTTAGLRGVSAVSDEVAWVSGSGGTVLRTLDGGATWQNVAPPDAAAQAFRDLEAFGVDTAVLLAIGTGEASRLYRTDDGGATWTKTYQNTDPSAFYDCMSFFDRKRGLVLGDPVGGKFQILATEDGGRSWSLLPNAGMPAALPGEFAFAASGTCIETAGGRDAWFATGGDAVSRVFHSDDRGRSWTVTETPVTSGPTAGIYSLSFTSPRVGIAVGGDFLAPTNAANGAAYTTDGGETWTIANGPGEYRSGSAWVPRLPRTAVAVGPTGSDVSRDGGRSWTRFDTGSLDAVDCAQTGACWGSGAGGRVARLRVER